MADLAERLLAAIEEREQRFMVPLEILRYDLIGQAAARIAAFTSLERSRVVATAIADRVLPADATHIVEDEPSVRRRCAADRRMVERHVKVSELWDQGNGLAEFEICRTCAYGESCHHCFDRDDLPLVQWPCPTLRATWPRHTESTERRVPNDPDLL